METECIFISTYGVCKSCTIYPKNFIAVHENKEQAYLTTMTQREGMSIYVCSNTLRFFVSEILPNIKYSFFLVSGNSDLDVPLECLSTLQYQELVDSKFLIKWLAQNCTETHHKIVQSPIGLDYHTIHMDPHHYWRMPNEGHVPIQQESILKKLRKSMKPFQERTCKIFSNVHQRMDKRNDRASALKDIPADLIHTTKGFILRTNTWELMTQFSFVLSPFGNGYDCHRTWEALCLGAIPIVRAPQFKDLFEELPVLNVKEWSDVTQELLENTIIEFKNKQFNYDKLTRKYWRHLMKFTP